MKILVATGGSSHSEIAVHFCAQLAPRAGKTVTVLTVCRHKTAGVEADAILAAARMILEPRVPDLHTRVRFGHPAENIICEAEEGSYDLVVVGEKHHSDMVSRFLLGSTAERVVEHAPCPVVVAKGQSCPIRRILLCDSGVRHPSLLGRFTTQLADLITGQEAITVLHVMSQMSAGPGVKGQQLRANAKTLIAERSPEGKLLEQDVRILKRLGAQPHPKVRHGLVVDEIVTETRAGNYDLLVIGVHPGQGWRRILLDDLARQIITQAPRPVLVVR